MIETEKLKHVAPVQVKAIETLIRLELNFRCIITGFKHTNTLEILHELDNHIERLTQK